MQILIQHLMQPSDSQHLRPAPRWQAHASPNPKSRRRKDNLRVAKMLAGHISDGAPMDKNWVHHHHVTRSCMSTMPQGATLEICARLVIKLIDIAPAFSPRQLVPGLLIKII